MTQRVCPLLLYQHQYVRARSPCTRNKPARRAHIAVTPTTMLASIAATATASPAAVAASSSDVAPPKNHQFPGSSGVIVYLTQGARHSSYGQSTMQQLRKSVSLLYEHYNARERDDVAFLHTGDVTLPMQASVLRLCGPEARFVQLEKHHWELPPGVDPLSKE